MEKNYGNQNPGRKILQPIQCISLNDSLIAITCSAFKDTVKGQVQVWNGKDLTFRTSYEFGYDSRPWHLIKSPINDEVFVALGGTTGNGGVACLTYTENDLELKWKYMNSDFNVLHGITIDGSGEYIYISGRGNHHLYQMDAKSGALISSVSLGDLAIPGGLSVMQNICTDCD